MPVRLCWKWSNSPDSFCYSYRERVLRSQDVFNSLEGHSQPYPKNCEAELMRFARRKGEENPKVHYWVEEI